MEEDGPMMPQSTLEQTYSFDDYRSQGGDTDFDAWFGRHLVDFDNIFHVG